MKRTQRENEHIFHFSSDSFSQAINGIQQTRSHRRQYFITFPDFHKANPTLSSESTGAPEKCHNCSSELISGSVYCHKCGTSVSLKDSLGSSQKEVAKPHDYSDIALLLIKIGAILAFILPFATLAGVGFLDYGPFFGPLDNNFLGAFIVAIVLGVIFGIIALRFHKDIVAGRSDRIVHTIILGIVMFVLGSNVSGALVGFGAFLCYISPSVNKARYPG